MKFHFDGNQAYQLRAIESVATLFQGQPRVGLDWSGPGVGELFGPVRNRLLLDEAQLLANLQDVQGKNQLSVDDRLHCIEDEIQTASGKILARFPYSAVRRGSARAGPIAQERSASRLVADPCFA